jgi:hypothetical protein
LFGTLNDVYCTIHRRGVRRVNIKAHSVASNNIHKKNFKNFSRHRHPVDPHRRRGQQRWPRERPAKRTHNPSETQLAFLLSLSLSLQTTAYRRLKETFDLEVRIEIFAVLVFAYIANNRDNQQAESENQTRNERDSRYSHTCTIKLALRQAQIIVFNEGRVDPEGKHLVLIMVRGRPGTKQRK